MDEQHAPEPDIESVKSTLAEHGISVARLCRKADLAESTWHRWTLRGVEPRDSSWGKIIAALTDLVSEKLAKAAA